MDINLLTIGISFAMPAQPVQPNTVRGPGKADCSDELGRDGSQPLETERSAAKKWGEQSVREGVIRRDDIQPSDNITCGTRISEKEPNNEHFENVFRRQLKPDESLDESGDGKVAIKPQKTDISDKSGELQPSISLQNGVLPLVEQKKPTEDLKQEPKQTKPIIRQTVSQTTEPSLKDTSSAVIENQGKNVQKEVLQQNEMISNATSTQVKPVIPSTTAEGTSVQQGEQQRQITGTRETLADGKQTTGNASTIKPHPINDAGLGKTVESTNQQKPAGDTESVNFNTRQGSVQPKAQPATISNDTLTGNSVVSRVQEQITAGGQQGGVETANNANNGRVKDKAGSDSQKASRQLPGDGQGAGEISEKLNNVEKAELSSGMNNTPKSESGSNSAHNSPAQTGGFGSVQTTAAAPSVIAGSSAKNSANVPVQDNVASVREQIYQSVRSSIQQGDSQITIRLNPPELGQVSVKFSERGNELTGLLEATNPQTRAEIRQAIPEIIRSLEESGINIKRIDVMLSSDSPRQSAQQQSSRDNASADLWEQFSQHGFLDSGGNRPSHDSYLTTAYSGDTNNEVRSVASFGRNQSLPSDNLLDVLI